MSETITPLLHYSILPLHGAVRNFWRMRSSEYCGKKTSQMKTLFGDRSDSRRRTRSRGSLYCGVRFDDWKGCSIRVNQPPRFSGDAVGTCAERRAASVKVTMVKASERLMSG